MKAVIGWEQLRTNHWSSKKLRPNRMRVCIISGALVFMFGTDLPYLIKLCFQLKPITTICRTASSLCDLSEYCSGVNNTCPSDVYKQNGLSCTVAGVRSDHCLLKFVTICNYSFISTVWVVTIIAISLISFSICFKAWISLVNERSTEIVSVMSVA
jgi:hypothetical protein